MGPGPGWSWTRPRSCKKPAQKSRHQAVREPQASGEEGSPAFRPQSLSFQRRPLLEEATQSSSQAGVWGLSQGTSVRGRGPIRRLPASPPPPGSLVLKVVAWVLLSSVTPRWARCWVTRRGAGRGGKCFHQTSGSHTLLLCALARAAAACTSGAAALQALPPCPHQWPTRGSHGVRRARGSGFLSSVAECVPNGGALWLSGVGWTKPPAAGEGLERGSCRPAQ